MTDSPERAAASPSGSGRWDHARLALAGLTPRGRAFLAAGVSATTAGVVLDQRDLVRIGILLLALPLAAAALLTRSRYRISAQRKIDRSRGPVGSLLRVEVTVHNLSHFPTPLLMGQDALPPELGAAAGDGARFLLNRIGSGGESTLSYAIRPVQRGRYVVGPLSVRLADPFGFCQILRTFSSTDGLSILPAVVPLPTGHLGGEWNAGGDNRARGIRTGGEQDVTTRPYVTGDDRRRVHWRTTARTGELAVRREEQPWQSQATLLIDTRADAHSIGQPSASFEFAVTAAASIAAAVVKAGYGLRLIDDVGRILADAASTPGESGFAVMDALADLPLKAGETLLPVANRISGLSTLAGRGQEASTIAVLGSLSGGDAEALARAAQGGVRCMALLVDSPAWMPGSSSHPVATQAGTAEANRDLLRLAGWSVAIARPQTSIGALWQELNATDPTRLRRWVG